MVFHSGWCHLVLWTCLASLRVSHSSDEKYHVAIEPQSPVVEIGKNFTAMCSLNGTSKVTAGDLFWLLSKSILPREQYTKINQTAVNVTIMITSETSKWLYCKCNKTSAPHAMMDSANCMHGIFLRKGYPPEKPQNLSCLAYQESARISSTISCFWEPGTRGTWIKTNYTLHVGSKAAVTSQNNSGQITLDSFPHYMDLNVVVEAENELGKVQSDPLTEYADCFVKTNPPTKVELISEQSFECSLLINWTRPINGVFVKLIYQIRFCSDDSHIWKEVPLSDTFNVMQSFRLQKLSPYTNYITQVRCKPNKTCTGYWSDWSINATAKTPEAKPTSQPDLWRIIIPSTSRNKRKVVILCKDPVRSNGKIKSFDMRVRVLDWERVSIEISNSRKNSDPNKLTRLKELETPDGKSVTVEVIARNSVGESPKARLVIPGADDAELPPVETVECWSHSGQLWVKWQLASIAVRGGLHKYSVTAFVVEWVSVSDGQMDWQRENGNATNTAIRGKLQKYTRYNVSVYPLHSEHIGKGLTIPAFLEQEVPLEGPSVRLKGRPGSSEAELEWKEIPLDKQRGFIVNYTIFYSHGSEEHAVSVPAGTYSYQLKSLSPNTNYAVRIRASTIKGSVDGIGNSFSTLKYAPGQIEGIVVGVCLAFLFSVVVVMLLCIYKKDFVRKHFWPTIPNPKNSSVSTWSPDFPSKVDTPQENILTNISGVEVDVFNGKSSFEEDRNCLPLKKDKCLSEEQSSSIGGGSSCLSSQCQSMSDSDENGDLGETTASTVQYSSVVASHGYKGQNPSSHSQQPALGRSESTQPLLDSENNGDMLGTEQHRHISHDPCPNKISNSAESTQLEMEEQWDSESLGFWPLEEVQQQWASTESRILSMEGTTRTSNYMPQLAGYRTQ